MTTIGIVAKLWNVTPGTVSEYSLCIESTLHLNRNEHSICVLEAA